MSPPIFISYSSKDQDVAETIYQALEARGQQCWIACRDVRAGENYQESIVRALRSARVMLLIFTSNANNSEEIKKELVLAGRHRVTVVPVRVEDVAPNDAFTYEFATRQWVDLFKDWESAIEQLSVQLNHLLQMPQADAAAAGATPTLALTPRAPPPKPRSLKPLWIGAGVIAAAVIAGVFVYQRKPGPAAPPLPQETAAPPPVVMRVPPPQTAAQTPAVAPATPATPTTPPPVTPAPSTPAVTAPPPAPPLQATPALSPDETAWQSAETGNTIEALRNYLKAFPTGLHAQAAELRLLDLMLGAPATAAKAFDGTWQTIWTCPAVGGALGYSAQFNTQIRDGALHGVHGAPGERGSIVLDGKLEADGNGAVLGKGVVGSSTFAVGGQPAGTAYVFHVAVHLDRTTGNGRRIEGRPCDATFTKQ